MKDNGTQSKERLIFSLKKAFIAAAIITLAGYIFVKIADYKLSTSKENFAIVLFLVMFVYKTIRNYFYVWGRNE